MQIVDFLYGIFWNDLFSIPLPGGSNLGISLMVLLLIPVGIYFTIRTKVLPIRFFPEMLKLAAAKKQSGKEGAISGFQALIVSTATRVGSGNLVGVVAALSTGGPGAIFWMWVTALIGSSTAFIEATLAQQHKVPDPLYGGFKGGPAYYMQDFFGKKEGRKNIIAVLFAVSGLICWGGVSQVMSNSVTSAVKTAFGIPAIVTTVIIVAIAAFIVLRKNATVKVLDVMAPFMAIAFFVAAIVIICMNLSILPEVFRSIFSEAFGIKPILGGGIGAALSQGVQRGLFSNEAGSGSAPCAAAAADVDHPVKSGLFQAFGVIIDTIVICTCTAMIMLLAPSEATAGLTGMPLLQSAMNHHFGYAGVVFIAITLFLFCFSTFLGILYYARSNVSFLFGDKWAPQTAYKIFALGMFFIGGLAAYTFVWAIADIGVALMTVFNLITIVPMGGRALEALKDYTAIVKARKQK